MDFFEHQENARKKTSLLIFLFAITVGLIVLCFEYIVFIYWNNKNNVDENFEQFLNGNLAVITACIVLAWITISSAYALIQRKKQVTQLLRQLNAQEIYNHKNCEKPYRRLLNLVQEMSIASGVSVPRVYILKKQSCINAFVLGSNIHLASLIFTQGAVDHLDKPALRALVAHEFSHIFHGDMVLNYRMLGLLGGIDSFSQLGKWILVSTGLTSSKLNQRVSPLSSRRSNNAGLILVLIGGLLYIIGYIGHFFSSAIRALVTKQRAYLADSAAVQYTRDEKGICDTLYQVAEKQGSYIYAPSIQNINFMCFAKSKYTGFDFEFSSHPSPTKRINRINSTYLKLIQLKKYKKKPITEAPKAEKKVNDMQALSPALEMGVLFALNNKQPKAQTNNKAKTLIALIPKHIHDNLHHASMAQGLTLVLLLNDDATHFNEQIHFIEKQLKTRQTNNIKNLHTELKPNLNKLRLVLLNLLLPTLQNLKKKQQKTLLHFCKKLILLDEKIDFFEFCVYTLLKKSLTDFGASYKRTFFQLQSVKNEIIECSYFLLSKEKGDVNIKINEVAERLKLNINNFTKPAINFNQLYKAIIKLNALTPILKKQLITNWHSVLFKNQQPCQTTQDAFKLICLCLEVPVALN